MSGMNLVASVAEAEKLAQPGEFDSLAQYPTR
jgi:hypothetical protein